MEPMAARSEEVNGGEGRRRAVEEKEIQSGAGLTDRRRKQCKHSLSHVALTPDCFSQAHNQLEMGWTKV